MEQTKGKRVFKVLSIDGGGIKGLYTAAVLNELEKKFAPQPGKLKLGSYFDLIAGTSTGALIASAIAAGKTCNEILEEYLKMGQSVFPDTVWYKRTIRSIKQSFIGARYSNESVANALDSLLGEKRFSQSNNYLVIPVTNITNYSPRIFKTKHSNQHAIEDCRLKDIALASAAAPTFFPLVSAPDKASLLYADGGLVANNPTLIAALEALTVFVGPQSELKSFDSLAVLSLGTYGSPTGFRFGGLSKSIAGWMAPQKRHIPLIGALMDAQTKLAFHSTQYLMRSSPELFVRFERRDAERGKARSTPTSNLLDYDIADARDRKMKELHTFGATDGQSDASDPDIAYFFKDIKQPVQLFR